MTNLNNDLNRNDDLHRRAAYDENEDRASFVGISVAAVAVLVMLAALVFYSSGNSSADRTATNTPPATSSTTSPPMAPRPPNPGPNG